MEANVTTPTVAQLASMNPEYPYKTRITYSTEEIDAIMIEALKIQQSFFAFKAKYGKCHVCVLKSRPPRFKIRKKARRGLEGFFKTRGCN